MSVFGKIITTVFGKKSDKDIRELKPYVGLINSQYEKLQSLSDSELKDCFIEIKNKLKTNIVQENENLLQEGLDESKIDAQLSLIMAGGGIGMIFDNSNKFYKYKLFAGYFGLVTYDYINFKDKPKNHFGAFGVLPIPFFNPL